MEIGVRDEGPGVPEKDRERIFDLYRRGLGASASEEEGAGLGLATVRKIAERHGGRGSVDSRPGRGATFWIGFPVGPDVALAEHASAVGAAEPGRSWQARPFSFAAPEAGAPACVGPAPTSDPQEPSPPDGGGQGAEERSAA